MIFPDGWAADNPPGKAQSLSIATLTNKGHQLYSKGLYHQAAVAYRQALELSGSLSVPLRVAAMNNLGAALRENRQYEEAEHIFSQALSLATTSCISDQDIEQVRKQYAYLLRKMKREKEAIAMEFGTASSAKPQAATNESRWTRVTSKEAGMISTKPSSTFDAPSASSSSRSKTYDTETLQSLAEQRPDDEKIWLTLAQVYRRENNQEKLFSTLRHIVGQFPSNGRALRELALLLLKHKRSAEAVLLMQSRYKSDPKDPKNYRAMAQLYMETGEINLAMDVLQEFLVEFPNDEYAAKAKEQIAYFTKETSTMNSNELGKTYSKSQSGWSKEQMPLKVFISTGDNAPTLNAEENVSSLSTDSTVTLLERAFSDWQIGSSGAVSFTFVQAKDDADIICKWMNSSATMYHDSAQGMTQTSKGKRGAVKTISILLYGPDGHALSTDEFYEICLHEIGHALGLGHSSEREDIMYPSTRQMPVTSLSQRDREALSQLYRL